MKFSANEIVDSECSRNWFDFSEKLRVVVPTTDDQWIFRALGKWNGPNVTVMSTFDEACERPSQEKISPELRKFYESWMLLEFKREATNYLPYLPEPKDFLAWLSIARHYGMPSRLLDFTYSFHVAAYFALSERGRKFTEQRDEEEDGCILAVNLTWMKNDFEKRLRERWCQQYNIEFAKASFHNPELIWKFGFEAAEKYVVAVSPLRRNPRLAMQRGLFLFPGNIEKEFDENLQQTLHNNDNVKKLIRLRPHLRSEAIRDLKQMNISSV
ncbi:MAG: hypothetical protein HW419_4164, partial [Deltaproteobacteria bacterium]|nr:hypothetical protein [Deltaproteobacteria bacterium]